MRDEIAICSVVCTPYSAGFCVIKSECDVDSILAQRSLRRPKEARGQDGATRQEAKRCQTETPAPGACRWLPLPSLLPSPLPLPSPSTWQPRHIFTPSFLLPGTRPEDGMAWSGHVHFFVETTHANGLGEVVRPIEGLPLISSSYMDCTMAAQPLPRPSRILRCT